MRKIVLAALVAIAMMGASRADAQQALTWSGAACTVDGYAAHIYRGTYTGAAPSAITWNVNGLSLTTIAIGNGVWSASVPEADIAVTASVVFYDPANTADQSPSYTDTLVAANAGGTTDDNMCGSNSGSSSSSSQPSTTSIPPNDPSIYYSPANWAVTATSAETVNPGAYFRTMFPGSTAPTLAFNIAGDTISAVPTIEVVIDGQAPQFLSVAATVTPTMPTRSTNYPQHILQVIVGGVASTATTEYTGARTKSVVFTGLSMPGSSKTIAPSIAPKTTLLFGDSITAGFRTLGSGYDDATQTALWKVATRDLASEFGVIASSGEYLSPMSPTTSGAAAGALSNDGIPPLPDSFANLWTGQPRAWPAKTDYVVIALGTNDALNSGNCAGVAEGVAKSVAGIAPHVPGAKIMFLEPYAFYLSSNTLQACYGSAVALAGASLISTSGMAISALTADGIHPLGILSEIMAPEIAALMLPIINARSYTYGP